MASRRAVPAFEFDYDDRAVDAVPQPLGVAALQPAGPKRKGWDRPHAGAGPPIPGMFHTLFHSTELVEQVLTGHRDGRAAARGPCLGAGDPAVAVRGAAVRAILLGRLRFLNGSSSAACSPPPSACSSRQHRGRGRRAGE